MSMRHDIYLHLVVDEQGRVTSTLTPAASAGPIASTQSEAAAPSLPVDVPAALAKYFARMSQSSIQEFMAGTTRKIFKRGELIVKEGDRTGDFFVLLSGRTRRHKLDNRGRETPFGFPLDRPGELLGAADLFNPCHTFSAIALEDCEALEVTRESFVIGAHRNPQLALNVLEVAIHRTKQLLDQQFSWRNTNSRERLAEILIDLAANEGQKVQNGFEIPTYFTHDFLAALCDTVRETVTGHLKDLEQEGGISREGRSIIVRPGVLALIVKR